jgi:hypothetical protein
MLVGLLPLIRPVAVYLPWVLAPLVFWTGPRTTGRLRAAFLLLLLGLIPNAVWSFASARHLGDEELKGRTSRGKAVFARNVEDRLGIPRPPLSLGIQPWQSFFGRDQGLSPSEAQEIRNRYFVRTIRTHPLAALHEWAVTALHLLGVPDSSLPILILGDRVPPFRKGTTGGRIDWLRRLGVQGVWLAMGMGISLGGFMAMPALWLRARRWDRGRKALLAIVVAAVLYQIAISAFIAHQAERYRVPVIPLLAVMLGVALLGAKGAAHEPVGSESRR